MHFKTISAASLGLALTFAPFLCGATWAQNGKPAPDSLVSDGDFEAPAGGKYDVWQGTNQPNVSLKTENGNTFLHLSNSDAARGVSIKQTIRFAPPAAGQRWVLSDRVRVTSATPGTQSFETVRLQTRWLDDAGKAISPWPFSPAYKRPTGGCVEFSSKVEVPATATRIVIEPAIYNSTGEADFDDLMLRPVDAPPLTGAVAPTEVAPFAKIETKNLLQNGDFESSDGATGPPWSRARRGHRAARQKSRFVGQAH